MKNRIRLAAVLIALSALPLAAQIQVGAGGGSGGGGGTPGGANTNVQFNSSATFGGDSGFTYGGTGQVGIVNSTVNTAPLTSTGYSLTGSGATSLLSLTGTINTTGSPDIIALHITDTARGAATKLINLYGGASGTTSMFSVDRQGAISAAGGNTKIDDNISVIGGGGSVSAIYFIPGNVAILSSGGVNGSVKFTDFGAGTNSFILTMAGATATPRLLLGANDAAAPVAQQFGVQSVVAGTSNTAGQNFTILGSLSTGSGTSGDIILQTGGTGAGATVQNSAVTALTIKGGTQLVQLNAITSDATHTDASVCEDTTTHALYSGSGTLGICLGTSSARYKNNIVDLSDGLAQVMALEPKNFFYNSDHGDNGAREQYGFLAEDVAKVLPKLVALDADGKPNSVDILGMVPILVKAIQDQQAKIDGLESRLAALETGAQRHAWIDDMPVMHFPPCKIMYLTSPPTCE